MKVIEKKAYAKINVILNVLGKRPDGMHQVDMIMTPLALHDLLRFETREDDVIEIISDADMGEKEANLIYKAIKLLQTTFNISTGVDVYVEKNIPMQAGLAGGSSDCAATLEAMNTLWSLNLTLKDLEPFARKLGADVPYCLYHQTMRVRGIGEKLTTITPFPKMYVTLIKQHYGVSTKEAYESLPKDVALPRGKVSKMEQAIASSNSKAILKLVDNSFEKTVFAMHPDLAEIKAVAGLITPGVLLSGSGPTLFMLHLTDESSSYIERMFMTRDVTIIQTETK